MLQCNQFSSRSREMELSIITTASAEDLYSLTLELACAATKRMVNQITYIAPVATTFVFLRRFLFMMRHLLNIFSTTFYPHIP